MKKNNETYTLDDKNNPFYRIHKIDWKFNKFFSKPLYLLSILITYTQSILPYSGRMILAYLINIFFNRPTVYLNIFAEKIWKRMHFIILLVFYFSFFWIYAIFYKIFKFFFWKKNKWIKIDTFKIVDKKESYYYQS